MPAEYIDGPTHRISPEQGKMPVGILSNFDGNFSSNFAGKKNVRTASGVCYGEDCDMEADVPESGW